jgi:hypothetical protein
MPSVLPSVGTAGAVFGLSRRLWHVPISALMERNPGVSWNAVDEVVFGTANQAGEDNRNVACMVPLPISMPGGQLVASDAVSAWIVPVKETLPGHAGGPARSRAAYLQPAMAQFSYLRDPSPDNVLVVRSTPDQRAV